MKKTALTLTILFLVFIQSCDVVDSISGKSDDNKVKLYPVQIDDRWGYINSDGQLQIEPDFQWASLFHEGLAVVRESNRWKYIDMTGEVVIEGNFSSIRNFSQGKAAVRFDGRWGYINTSGNFVINPKFRDAHLFSNGRAFVRSLHNWGYYYIDEKGDKIESVDFSGSFDFVETNEFRDGLALVRDDDEFGYIDKSGNAAIDLKYNEAYPFSEKLAAVKISDKWGFISSSEAVEIAPQFISAGNFGNGLAPVRKSSNLFGYVDKSGNMVISEQFEIAETFQEDRAAVFNDGKWTFIDKAGNQITSPKFDEVEPFFNGLAKVTIRIPNEMDDEFTEKAGYINKSGQYVWFPTN
jgi:hypothetical protein